MPRVLLIGLLALLSAPAGASQKQTAKDVVARVQKFYKGTAQYKAKFRQVYTNTVAQKDTKSSGLLRAKKPGKLRWDYANKKKKTRQSFYAVDKKFWSVDHEDKQVIVGDVGDSLDAVALTFLVGKGDLAKQFKPSLDTKSGYGDARDIVVKLEPKKPSARYSSLYLVVSSDNYRVKRSVVVEASGNTNSFEFFEPDTKTAIADDKFKVPLKKYRKAKYKIVRP